ncbi:ABC transporter permease [Mucilaginibacter ginsenosidivorans]|uniref:FtsX-like permease family protein n=1 Tax=Mucilaginibacter ginsenosidivorans TaxID=398053 RepID=A0A5B8UZZ0_9SPHI|nr:ABC transporter permease [Mucilaginibacter ginsenosidivorans]QEC64143.1 FtsX-like permease family protein [Mucilaginibacter ginsenosidivorans]
MIRNYFKIAFRRLQKNKPYTFVNIIGLTAGIASCLLIGLFIINDLSYDRFNTKADRIVRMTMQYDEGGKQKVALSGTKAGPQLQRTFPQVEAFVRIIDNYRVVKYGSEVFTENRFLYADSSFLKVFSFPLLEGDAGTALNAPNKVLISRTTAKKYFGNADAIGKTIIINDTKEYLVTGVLADAPENSQIKYDFVGSFTSLDVSKTEEWWTANYTTYLLLKDKNQLKGFQAQLNDYMRGVSNNELHLEANSPLLYNLEPLLSVHLYSQLDGLEPNGNINTVYILGVIALLILVIACINYTNLATVQSTMRSAEIGIRKVLGARKGQLFRQFIGESFLITLISLLAGVLIAYVLLPYFNHATGKVLTFHLLIQPLPLMALAALCILIALASGSYPAIVLSSTRLTSILKAGVRLTSSGGIFKKSLIVFQFGVSVCLIIATIIVVQQINYIQKKDLGYDKEHVIVLPMGQKARESYEAIKAQISLLPQVVSVSGANATPTLVQWTDGLKGDFGKGKIDLTIKALPSDIGFIKTMGMKIIAGTDYTESDLKLGDTSNNYKNFRYSFILNESAVKALGLTPQQAIGKQVEKNAPGEIKAVVKDFNFSSMHEPVGPLMLFLDRQWTNYIFIRVHGNDIPQAIASLSQIWKERVPSRPFEYHFLDDYYNKLYVSEQRTATVFSTFATLAILLACMGLFGLAAFTTVQRTREIGIRKVLGANVRSIVMLIANDFMKLTLAAVVLASPLAWYFMHKWLQDFAYRIDIQWWIFVLAGGVSVLIAFITVSFQSIKAALANPVESLRSE